MTSICLGTASALQYSVIAEDASAVPGGVQHVGLLSANDELFRDKEVGVLEMGPPLSLGASPGRMRAHSVGCLDLFGPGERDKLRLWLDELATQLKRPSYGVLPASVEEKETGTDRTHYTRFSCAGFVATCYERAAGIRLVVDESRLPEVDRTLTAQIWEQPHMHLSQDFRDRVIRRYGLRGEGPWRVLLPGYLLHALNRPRAELPYEPRLADWRFPRPDPQGAAAEHPAGPPPDGSGPPRRASGVE